MLQFQGGIGTINQSTVSGMAQAALHGQPRLPAVVLQFRTLGILPPTSTTHSGNGWLSFTFLLPRRFQEMPWTDFLNEFVGVIAYCPNSESDERWVVPIHIRALSGLNGTALDVERIQDYQIKPQANGRIAAFTIVYNEHVILPLWARYYSAQFGAENLYVIDHGSDRPFENLPPNVTIIRLPRDEFNNWLIARIVGFFQRVLLETYDSVLYTDSDEFVCASPDALAGRSLSRFLLELNETIGITRSYNLYHDVAVEPAYDPDQPVLSQRRMIERAANMDKPLISRVPLSWIPGFHAAREGGVSIPGLFMLHFRWFDLNAALIKGGHYRSSKWNPHDIATGLAPYQRDDESLIVSGFTERSNLFSSLRDTAFDTDAGYSVVADWMREAVFV